MNLRHQRLAKLGWEKTISKGSTGFCVGLHWWNATFPEKLAVLERSSMAQCIRCGHRGIFVSLSKFDKTTSQYKMMYAVESAILHPYRNQHNNDQTTAGCTATNPTPIKPPLPLLLKKKPKEEAQDLATHDATLFKGIPISPKPSTRPLWKRLRTQLPSTGSPFKPIHLFVKEGRSLHNDATKVTLLWAKTLKENPNNIKKSRDQ